MKRSTFSVLFFIKRTKTLRNGLAPIFVRITVNGDRTDFSSHYSASIAQWDSSKGRLKGKSTLVYQLNSNLDSIQNRILNKKTEMEKRDLIVNAQSLRNFYLGIDEERKTILEVFRQHNEQCKILIGKDFSYGTYERYETCLKHISDFTVTKYNRKDMNLNEITPQFIRDFEVYLKVNRNCCNNTTVKYIKNFKKIVRIAIANRWMNYDPFANIRFKLDEVEIEYLYQNEIEILCAKKIKNERLQVVKDIFLFCCFTGLAFVDVKGLKKNMIEKENDTLWINKLRRKSSVRFDVPLLKPAEQIFDKYFNNPDCQKDEKVLPVPSNQKMNEYLKEIANICGIQKNLTTHVARHTFATTVTLFNDIPLKVVSTMLGHCSIAMTEKYAKVRRELVKKSMESIKDVYAELIVE